MVHSLNVHERRPRHQRPQGILVTSGAFRYARSGDHQILALASEQHGGQLTSLQGRCVQYSMQCLQSYCVAPSERCGCMWERLVLQKERSAQYVLCTPTVQTAARDVFAATHGRAGCKRNGGQMRYLSGLVHHAPLLPCYALDKTTAAAPPHTIVCLMGSDIS